MANVLLINPSYQTSYGSSKASLANPIMPTLGLAAIAGIARQRGHRVSILDLSWREYDHREISRHIHAARPDVVGVTATTPLMNQLRDISVLVKDISRNIVVVRGGAHPSALPEETIRESLLDAVCCGEADYSFAEICDGIDFEKIRGLCHRDGDRIARTAARYPIADLDELPMPAWDLYDPDAYIRHASQLLFRRLPATMAEFSRGCVSKCDFCASKITMSLSYRKKSPERCAAEVLEMEKLGFREFFLADDIFTSDQKWAAMVCEAIIASGADMAWTCTNGIRVESADDRLFHLLRQAGCYRVSFGFESGNDDILKRFGKGGRATIKQGLKAVRMARDADLDVNGFFQVGLFHDTEETIEETIDYARKLPLDMLKFMISIPFPGTPMFKDYFDRGMIRSFEWDDYHMYTQGLLYTHRHLSHQAVLDFMKRGYHRAVLFNPAYIVRRLIRGIRTGEFFWDLFYFIKYFSLSSTTATKPFRYYARDRWPEFKFPGAILKLSDYQIFREPQTERTGNSVDLSNSETPADAPSPHQGCPLRQIMISLSEVPQWRITHNMILCTLRQAQGSGATD